VKLSVDGKPAIVLWLVYFDARKSRKEGRRVPKKLAVPSPKLSELAKAVEELGFKCVAEADKKYPRCWWTTPGRVLVPKEGSLKKQELITKVAAIMKRNRELRAKK